MAASRIKRVVCRQEEKISATGAVTTSFIPLDRVEKESCRCSPFSVYRIR